MYMSPDYISAPQSLLVSSFFNISDYKKSPSENLAPRDYKRVYAKHEQLFFEGDSETHIFQVLDGVVGIYKILSDGRRQIVSLSYPGEFVSLGQFDKYTYNCEALCKSCIRCMPVSAVEKMIKTDPCFGWALLNMASLELASTREQLLTLGRKTAPEKIASFLLDISRRVQVLGQDPNRFNILINRGDIADYLGLTIETVSRNFTKLRKAEIIATPSTSQIVINDIERLKQISAEEMAF
jgi:CRP/FNR family transcriptional regulator, anaerobic regulatory protein